ncbi:HEAT repeat domain-containing protein [Candidatus Micrarchaeota archaeon]|nr:HEAT repeat domain-containing protein [Candidatus Micrarchaeota archaeon]MBU1166170.1 HEAT repeat domain-containing protein [Candidatus Micrarchaeota archaeon]MBU1886568.1 HEAT repeat domain-containing protein [Candidatus Micrarchaeota archaeon]
MNKLVSLTFDENPEVRKKAAVSLGTLDDPAALFALVELSYDKEPSVREVAQETLDRKKKTEPELMSFAEIFSHGSSEEKKEDEPSEQTKQKVLGPISQMFEKRLGKQKGAAVKKKMMPTIEKIYMKAVNKKHRGEMDTEENGRKAMQEFLTSYLEVISGIDAESLTDQTGLDPETTQPSEALAGSSNEPQIIEIDHISEGLQHIGGISSHAADHISSEIATIELEKIEEIKTQNEIEFLPDSFFKKAYETMMLSGGDDGIMKREMNNMVQQAKHEITLAFKFAKKKFKETKITNITKIRDRMRNINTEILRVVSIEIREYQKTKKVKSTYTRFLLNDEEGNEGVLYLFDGRGAAIKTSMMIKISGGMAKSFKFSSETALILGEKGNVYIVL